MEEKEVILTREELLHLKKECVNRLCTIKMPDEITIHEVGKLRRYEEQLKKFN